MKTWSNRKRFLICLLIETGLALLLLLSRGALTAASPMEFYQILCDALFVPGVLMTCFGLLIFISGDGFFDMIGYGIRTVFSLVQRKEKREALPKTFFDYRQMKTQHRRGGASTPLFAGICFLIFSVIALMLYNQAG